MVVISLSLALFHLHNEGQSNKLKQGEYMSHFYGQIDRSARKTIPTARAHKTTGLLMTARSWEGNITVELGYDETLKKDSFIIRRSDHNGCNTTIVARGWMDGSFTITEEIGMQEAV